MRRWALLGMSGLMILVLYLIAGISYQPEERISIDSQTLLANANRYVEVEGVVIDTRITDYGNQLIRVKNGSNSVVLFLQAAKPDVGRGNVIRAKGKVQKYQNEWEIYVLKKSDLILLESDGFLEIPELGFSPQRFEGMRVRVRGIAGNIHSSYFYLEGPERDFRLKVVASLPESIGKGEEIVVDGIFEWNPEVFSYSLVEVRGIWGKGEFHPDTIVTR
jgi:hypothetical protein